ncbi:MAG: tRNA pseudouridine(38-40) synthase TruA, partial [Candidatus Omnitrophica bacterium]|nr:tRNA pseudouridine(38-40) synthase TruA [Candidatus Omnitrophota bacterium]
MKTDLSVRYLGVTAYDGAGFAGWQKQGRGERTVQGDLENALKKIFKGPVPTFGASRTDVGVHAEGQAFHFDAPFEKNPDSLLRALNANLQKDMAVKHVKLAGKGFHACYSA